MKGVVTKVFHNRGFAFIRGEDNVSRFAHCRAFVLPVAFDMLREGDIVTFEPSDEGSKGNGERAVEVRVVT